MANHVALTHRTQYRYSRLVGLGPHVVRLRPAPHCRTPILAYSLRITPEPHFVNWQQDPFGNFMARIVVPDETREFSATVDLVADMATINPFDFFVEDAAASWPFTYEPVLAGELKPYLEPLPGTPLLDDYVRNDCRPEQHDSLHHRAQSQTQPGHRLPGPHGAGRAGAGRDAGACLGLVPRQRLAAGADPATRGSRGALCIRLPDPAPARWRRAPADPPKTSPTCTPGPKSISPARAGSGSIRRQGCWPAKDIFRWRRRRRPPARPRSPARTAPPRSISRSPCRSSACTKRRA